MKSSGFVLLILLILINGCRNDSDVPYETITVESYFCPEDDCEGILAENIQSANSKLYCAFYELELKSILKAIGDKSKTAEVRIVLDEGNYENNIKGNVKLASSLQYMHNKFCIIDDNRVLTGSVNPTENGVKYNNNNLIIINSRYIAENYNDEFDELWKGIYTDGEKVRYDKINSNNMLIENYFCPEDNCKEHIINTIKKAENDVHFMAFSFTDEGIADAMLLNDIEIKGIFENVGAGSQYSQYQRMKDLGIEAIRDKNPKTMHHKVFIIDNKIVITGSMNPTGSGNSRNDENILIIHDEETANRFTKEFNRLWEEFN